MFLSSTLAIFSGFTAYSHKLKKIRGSPPPDNVTAALQQVSTLLHRKPMRIISSFCFTSFERLRVEPPEGRIIDSVFYSSVI
jgi:hypothetical protein